MKKILFIAAVAFLGITSSFAQEGMDKLPANVQELIKTNYANLQIKKIKVDEGDMDERYKVKFENGTQLDFNSMGEINEIDGEERIPDALIPQKIKNYLATKYKGEYATEWEYENNVHEVELSNGTELEFTDKGEILERKE
ncbi:PepSY-like domain-containing protein [Mesonia ostreae]|uniref:PepSY-like domain-containing protein n=1 Tax=Mesonia ostreae TaxID=861110 RepID=A0ABU2KGD3_9FLAO|nr:PepSY-like domain-containing protein [Mesonia ostreae]MDT0293773.1 PepSY-like domain-containing protein [Mesonia ostreae]